MFHSHRKRCAWVGALSICAASSAVGQSGIWEETWHERGDSATYGFGGFLSAVGDIDRDGTGDFAVSAPYRFNHVGRVYLYSGASGQLLLDLAASVQDTGFGSSVLGVPDLDGDGFRDVLVGEPHWFYAGHFASGRVLLYSGKSGVISRILDGPPYASVAFGTGLDSAGDLDQDGVSDFLVATSSSHLAISGGTGAFLWGRYGQAVSIGPDPPFVSLAADVDGDSVPDVVEGEPSWPGPQAFQAGIVRLLSGTDGSIVWESPSGAVGWLGFNVDVIGDIDGDGVPDVLAGEPGPVGGGQPSPSRACVISGANGSVLRVHDSTSDQERIGWDVASLGGSWDSDEVPDYVVGAPWYSNPLLANAYEGRVDIYGGSNGALLTSFLGAEAGAMLGTRSASPGDLDGDGFPELLVSAPWEDYPGGPPDVGGAHMFSFRPLLTVAPSNLSLSAGTPSVAALDFPIQEAAWPYAVLASATGIGPTLIGGVEVPLSADPLLARMVGGWAPPLLQNGQGILDAQGDATALIHPSPALAAYLGRTFWIAAVSWDPGWGQVRLSSVARPLTVVP